MVLYQNSVLLPHIILFTEVFYLILQKQNVVLLTVKREFLMHTDRYFPCVHRYQVLDHLCDLFRELFYLNKWHSVVYETVLYPDHLEDIH